MTDQNSESEEPIDSDNIVKSGGSGSRPPRDRRRFLGRLVSVVALGILTPLLLGQEAGRPVAADINPNAPVGDIAYRNGNSTGQLFSWEDDLYSDAVGSLHVAGDLYTSNSAGTVTGGQVVTGYVNASYGITTSGNLQGLNVYAKNGNMNTLLIDNNQSGGAPSYIPLEVVGRTGQTANLQLWTSDSGVSSAVDKNGNFGIGTTSPAQQLEISSASGRMQITSTAKGNNSGFFFRVVEPAGSNYDAGLYLQPAVTGTYTNPFFGISADNSHYQFNVLNNGRVGIGTTIPDQALSVTGNADKSSGGTSWGTFCDRRWKDPDSIRRFELGLEWIRTLPSPVRFHYAPGNGIGADPDEENVNFIAQDLQDGVHDNLVYTTRSKVKATDKEPIEMYGVNVNDMHFAMVNAIKELAERNSELAQQNSELVEQNQTAIKQLTERDSELAQQNGELAEQNRALREEVRLLKTRLDTFEQTINLAAS